MQKKSLKEQINRKWYELIRWFCRSVCAILFRWRCYDFENIPKEGPFLLVSNHQSFLDPIFVGSRPKRHICYLARDTLFNNWFFGPLIRTLYAIPVKRQHGDLGAMRKVIDVLKEGDGVCLFPEGTRTHDGRILPFQAGLGLLCRRGKASIVPVLIDGAYECWPRTQKLFKVGMPVTVHYGKAITAQEVKEMGDEKLAQHLTDTLRQMQNDSRIEKEIEPYNYEETSNI